MGQYFLTKKNLLNSMDRLGHAGALSLCIFVSLDPWVGNKLRVTVVSLVVSFPFPPSPFPGLVPDPNHTPQLVVKARPVFLSPSGGNFEIG